MALLGQNHGKSCHCQANRKKSGHLKKNHATVRVFEKKLGQRKKKSCTRQATRRKNQATRKKNHGTVRPLEKKSRHC